MPSDSRITAFHRDILLAVVALTLLVAPLWVPAINIGDSTYTYARAQIVLDDEDGITYANETEGPFWKYISKDIGCSISRDVRPCAFERYLAANNTVPTEVYTNNPDAPHEMATERYRYVQVDGSVYETSYVGNRSVQNDAGLYRLDLALELASPADVLRAVSRDVSAEHVDVAPVVVEAAKEGEATSHHEVEVPQTPMRLDDGTYYRVYTAESSDAAPMAQFLRIVLPIAGPLIGLFIVFRLFQRIEVTYVGDKRGL